MKEVLDGGEEFNGVELNLLKILRNTACELPDALQHELGDTGLLGVGLCTLAGERSDDLEKKSKVDELKPEFTAVGKKSREPECVSLAWSADGQTLFAGYTDNIIRAWGVMSRA